MKKKTVALMMAGVLAIGCAIGGTLAWITDTTTEVKNTFTYGDINIKLDEAPMEDGVLNLDAPDNQRGAGLEFTMIPGYTMDKDPRVTLVEGSEPCYLFVKVEEANNVAANGKKYITYSVDTTSENKWTALAGVDGVYYKVIDRKGTAEDYHYILTNNQVTANGETVTKAYVDTIKDGTVDEPTLTFTAYASQLYKTNTEKFTVADAWANVQPNP